MAGVNPLSTSVVPVAREAAPAAAPQQPAAPTTPIGFDPVSRFSGKGEPGVNGELPFAHDPARMALWNQANALIKDDKLQLPDGRETSIKQAVGSGSAQRLQDQALEKIKTLLSQDPPPSAEELKNQVAEEIKGFKFQCVIEKGFVDNFFSTMMRQLNDARQRLKQAMGG